MIKITLDQYDATGMQLENESIFIGRPNKNSDPSKKTLMGGQYLLLGIGGCFCSTLFAAAASRDIKIEGLRAEVTGNIETTPKRFGQINIHTSYDYCSHPEEYTKLLALAEKGCISINTINRETPVIIEKLN